MMFNLKKFGRWKPMVSYRFMDTECFLVQARKCKESGLIEFKTIKICSSAFIKLPEFDFDKQLNELLND